MWVDLEKEDIVRLVRSQTVPYELVDEYTAKGYGRYVGGFSDKWVWSNDKLETLSEKELLILYKQFKDYWKEKGAW